MKDVTRAVTGWAALLVAALLLTAESAQGQQNNPAPSAGGYKIGVVNQKAVFDAYERQKTEFEQLQKNKESVEKQLQGRIDAFNKKKESFDKAKETLDEAALAKMAESLEEELSTIRHDQKLEENKINREAERLLDSLREDITAVIKDIADKGNYHLVLEGDPKVGGRTLLYYSTTLDITGAVIEEVNKRYKAKSAKPSR